jgi:protein-tyrosine phosphatase
MEKEIFCDSAGTLDYHRGKPADARMQKHARLRGYELNSISRPFEYDDFELFDWIITMDEDNYQQIKWFDQRINYADKIRRMTEFCSTAQVSEVPDPEHFQNPVFLHNKDQALPTLEQCCKIPSYVVFCPHN